MITLARQTLNKLIKNLSITENKLISIKNDLEGIEPIILSEGLQEIKLLLGNIEENKVVSISTDENEKELLFKIGGKVSEWDEIGITSLLYIIEEFKEKSLSYGKKYSRKGMIKRVLDERETKAQKADYKVKLANNLYGEHTLINDKGKSFLVTLWDFDNKTGYINNIDWKTNKLGTTKHILFLYNYLEENPKKIARLNKTFPFIEIFTDPLNEYKISWYFPGNLSIEEEELLNSYFGSQLYIENTDIVSFLSFLQKSKNFDRIKIREEVYDKIELHFENLELSRLQDQTKLDFSSINATLYPYQKEGVEFSAFKKGVIIADEMGLGKTLQAITTAIVKKEIFDFKKVLVICPASVKYQWKNEISKFSNEEGIVIEGDPKDRTKLYTHHPAYFHIINYETVLRDLTAINTAKYDFIILDEAQKIKNYETKTAISIKRILKKHALVITGTPIENNLLDIYSIVQFLDQKLLAPQWEFSYQHCIFDTKYKNKIHGYYNLNHLKTRLKDILIRREKKEVFDQLPNVIQKNIYVRLSEEQSNLHASFSRGIAKILGKKFKTTYDWQKLMLLLTNMRMVCNSSFLIDKQSNHSPKLIELEDILIRRLNIKSKKRKIIIFSEWVTMLNLIGDMLKKEDITFTKLTGKIPVPKRQALIKEFEENDDCSVFLSSESGGTGLNLQVADTVINFELPWNPAKKNQRIGRIDRIGQQKQKLHVFNLLSYDSIEMKIAAGISLKQNLFDGVLNDGNNTDEVDFSEKGKSQFIQQLEQVIAENDVSDEINDLSIIENDDLEENEIALSLENKSDQTEQEKAASTSRQKKGSNSLQNTPKVPNPEFKQIENVMTKGMEFLTGLYEMNTGKKLTNDTSPKVKVDSKTGEVSISFKLHTN